MTAYRFINQPFDPNKKTVQVIETFYGVRALRECLGDAGDLSEGTYYYGDQTVNEIVIRENDAKFVSNFGIRSPYPVECKTYVLKGQLWLISDTAPRAELFNFEFVN